MPKKTTPTPTKTTTKTEPLAPSPIVPNTKITITIPWEKAEPAYNKARNQVAQTVKIAGFRKGKVPADVAEKMMGTAQIIEKAVESVLPEAYVAAIKTDGRKPLTNPSFRGISLEVGQEWVIEAEIAERPQVVLTDYKKIVKEAKKTAIDEIETQQTAVIKAAQEAKKEQKPAAPDHSDHNHGSDDDHSHSHTPRPLTEVDKRELTLQHIYQALILAIKPQIPELLVRHEVEYEIEQLARQLQSIQMTFEQYLERRGITQEQLTQQMAAAAVGRIQLVCIIDTIAEENKLVVSDSEVTAYITEKVAENLRAQYTASPDYKHLISQTILRQKVADSLLAI